MSDEAKPEMTEAEMRDAEAAHPKTPEELTAYVESLVNREHDYMSVAASIAIPPPVEHPILMSAPMISAILAGRKTQTRRLIKAPKWSSPAMAGVDFRCRYGVPGDRLWVRETWQTPWKGATQNFHASPEAAGLYDQYAKTQTPKVIFAADKTGLRARRWRPSLFMPRWASRILLEVTEIRVQRLQDISEADARAEGFSSELQPARINGEVGQVAIFDPRRWFATLWDSINADRAPWASNPWIWAISFVVVKP